MGDMVFDLFNDKTWLSLEKVNILDMMMINGFTMLLFYKKKHSDLLFASVRHLDGNNADVTLCAFEREKSKKILFEEDYIIVLSKGKSFYSVETIYGINEQCHMPMNFISKYNGSKHTRSNFVECQGPDVSGVGSYTLKKLLK